SPIASCRRRRLETRRSFLRRSPAPRTNWCRRRRARSPPRCRARGDSRARRCRPRCAQTNRGCRPRPRRRSCGCCRLSPPPHAPALLEARWLGRLFQYLRTGKRDVVGKLFALRRKADGAAANRIAASVHERIQHDVEELIGELKGALLRAGRGFAREQRQRIGEIGSREPEDRDERGRQRPPLLKKLLSALATLR